MTTRNPKQEGSNLFDCKPQVGLCPLNCNQCFYNRPGAFYVDINQPHIPTPEEVGEGIVRINCGHDSNIERDKCIETAKQYKHYFFNTSIPRFDFPAPVVYTANRNEEFAILSLRSLPTNLMFVRLRVSSTNLYHIESAVLSLTMNTVPIVLTFMAYYTEPPDKDNYEWKVRHINSYWCAKKEFIIKTLDQMKYIGGNLVTMCGLPNSNWCKDCRNCETYYWQTLKRMNEIKDGGDFRCVK